MTREEEAAWMERNDALIGIAINRCRYRLNLFRMDLDDARAEARLAMLQAIREWSPDHPSGASIKTFACSRAYFHLYKLTPKQNLIRVTAESKYQDESPSGRERAAARERAIRISFFSQVVGNSDEITGLIRDEPEESDLSWLHDYIRRLPRGFQYAIRNHFFHQPPRPVPPGTLRKALRALRDLLGTDYVARKRFHPPPRYKKRRGPTQPATPAVRPG